MSESSLAGVGKASGRRPAARRPPATERDTVTNFLVILLAIAVSIELLWFAGVDRYAEPVSVSIESTELWYNPWPAPGDRTDVANGQSRIPPSARVPADHRKTGAAAGDRRTTF
jgi:hypothetical protein